jgi:hypothetical protein
LEHRVGQGILTRSGLDSAGSVSSSCTDTSARDQLARRLDVKKLDRIHAGAGKRAFGDTRRHGAKGYEYAHAIVDDRSRLAYPEVLDDEIAATAAGFPHRAIAHCRRYGIHVEAILTDNGACSAPSCPRSLPPAGHPPPPDQTPPPRPTAVRVGGVPSGAVARLDADAACACPDQTAGSFRK